MIKHEFHNHISMCANCDLSEKTVETDRKMLEKPMSMKCNSRPARPAVKGNAVFRRVVTGACSDGVQKSHISNTQLYCTYPLKLLVPEYASSDPTNCSWLYVITYGGGMVEGDRIAVDVDVGKGCNIVVTTQAATKVFQSEDGLTTEQTMTGRVDDGGLLGVLPDPLVCYKDAIYKQNQTFDLSEKGNIILLDWLTAGRIARGEVWQMTSFETHNKVSVNGRLVFGDAIRISNNSTSLPIFHDNLGASMGQFMVFGTCLFFGPKFKEEKLNIMQKVNRYGKSNDHMEKKDVLSFASVLDESLGDGVVVKVAAITTELALSFFTDVMEDLFPLIGGNPLKKQ